MADGSFGGEQFDLFKSTAEKTVPVGEDVYNDYLFGIKIEDMSDTDRSLLVKYVESENFTGKAQEKEKVLSAIMKINRAEDAVERNSQYS